MTIELLYTSAAQGLKQGSRGFCTVVCTAGLPINLAQRLEALSGYRHLYQTGDVKADVNPVCHSHIRLVVGGKTLSIVSRVAAYGVDYSQRTNKIAHHVVFDGSVPLCGPAAVLSQSTVMRATWDGECRTLASGPVVPAMSLQPAPCQHWQRMAGDAGWAGVVANAWLQPTGKPVWIIFSESQSQSLLMMMQEATALLPESRRWQATFSTYCTNLPPDVECRVRCVVAGSDEARMSIARGVVLDLTKPLGMATENEAAEAARNGFVIGNKTSSIPAVASSPDSYEEPDNDFETAFEEGTSGEEAYGLQPRLPSVAPILLKSPKIRGKQKAKRVVAEPQDGSLTNKTLLLATAGVAIFLCLLGGIAIWFARSSPVAGIVGGEPAPKQEEPLDLATQNGTDLGKNNVEVVAPDNKPASTSATPPKEHPNIFIVQSIHKIIENDEVPTNFRVALLSFENTKPDEFKISTDSSDFEVVGSEIHLKPKTGGYNHEMNSQINGTIRVTGHDYDNNFDISLVVEDADDPNLEIMLLDENQQKNPKAISEGTRLIASVVQGSIDEDEIKPLQQSFVWKGRTNDGPWEDFANGDSAVLNSRYSEICCELQYASKFPAAPKVTKVESKYISVLPSGTGKIKFESIVNGKNLDVEIRVDFPRLVIENKLRYPFKWATHDHFLSGNAFEISHKIKFIGNDKSTVELSADDLRFVSNADLLAFSQLIQKVITQSNAISKQLKQLKSALMRISPANEGNRIQQSVVGFVKKIEWEPTDQFFQSIEMIDSWLKQTTMLKKLVGEIAEHQKNSSGSDADIAAKHIQKAVVLNDLLVRYKQSFAKGNNYGGSPNDAEKEIFNFVALLGQDVDINKSKKPKPTQGAVNTLSALIESIRSLRESMQELSTREFILESTEKIKVWPSVATTVSGEIEGSKEKKPILFASNFFLKTKVIIDDFKIDNTQTR